MHSDTLHRIAMPASAWLIMAGAVALPSGTSAQEPSASLLLGDCKGADPSASYYRTALRAMNVEGRVLYRVERTPEGDIRILGVEASEPSGVFDREGGLFLARFKCMNAPMAQMGRVSVTFSLTPGSGVPDFEGADAALQIVEDRIQRPVPVDTSENLLQRAEIRQEISSDPALSPLKDSTVFWLSIFIRPDKDTPNLRGVALYSVLNRATVLTIEPASLWSDGTPMSASARISDSQTLDLVRVLDRRGIFKNAEKYYSKGGFSDPQSHPPPDGALNMETSGPGTRPPKPKKPGYDLNVRISDSYWVTYYQTTSGTSKSDRRLIRELIDVLDGDPAELLSRLEEQFD